MPAPFFRLEFRFTPGQGRKGRSPRVAWERGRGAVGDQICRLSPFPPSVRGGGHGQERPLEFLAAPVWPSEVRGSAPPPSPGSRETGCAVRPAIRGLVQGTLTSLLRPVVL